MVLIVLGMISALLKALYLAAVAQPILSSVVVLVVAGVGVWLCRLLASKRAAGNTVLPAKPPWTVTIRPSSPSRGERQYQEQLSILTTTFPGAIRPVALLEGGECAPFYAALDSLEFLKPATERWHVHAQVSMGEFLETSFDKARPTFNSKRVDLLICNRYGEPVLVIEHQGVDHIKTWSAREDELRNQVKHLVLEKAGLPLLETPAGVSGDVARDLIVARLKQILETVNARPGRTRH